jgi:protein-disulfide isomerase
MALVKITVTCNHCKHDHEEYDETKMDDREKYLSYWNLPFEGEEADKAWAQTQEMTPKETAMAMSDIDGYVSQVDGSWIKSRSQHRSHLKQHKMIELGNDVPQQHKAIEVNQKSNEARKRQIAELAYAKLNYR